MVSTQSKPWKSIPRGPLMKRLEEKTGSRSVRSDSLPVADAPRGRGSRPPAGFRRGPLWIDYVYRL